MMLGLGCTLTDGDVGQPDALPGGRVDRQVLDGGHAVAGGRGAPHDDVVGLARPEDVADLLAGHEGRGRPTDVARFQPVALGLGKDLDRHLDLRHVRSEVDVGVRRVPGICRQRR